MKKTMVVVVMVGCGGGPLVAMVTMGWRCVVMMDVKIPDRSRFRVSGFGFQVSVNKKEMERKKGRKERKKKKERKKEKEKKK